MLFPCLLLFSRCVFGFCCFSAVTHPTLKPWVPNSSDVLHVSHFVFLALLDLPSLRTFPSRMSRARMFKWVVGWPSGYASTERKTEREWERWGNRWLGLLISRLAGATYPHSRSVLEISHSIVKNNRLNDATVWGSTCIVTCLTSRAWPCLSPESASKINRCYLRSVHPLATNPSSTLAPPGAGKRA